MRCRLCFHRLWKLAGLLKVFSRRLLFDFHFGLLWSFTMLRASSIHMNMMVQCWRSDNYEVRTRVNTWTCRLH